MATHHSEEKTSKKYVWFLIILPLGLVIGTVTSLIQHLRKDREEQDQQQYQTAASLNADDIRSSMQSALLLGKRDLATETGRKNITTTQRFIEGNVSPGGAGYQFITKPVLSIEEKTITLSYVDIPGKNPKNIIAVVIELPGEPSLGDAAKIGLPPALIRALTKQGTTHTLRFVFSPVTASAEKHNQELKRLTLASDERLLATLVLKLCDSLPLDVSDQWMLANDLSSSLQQSLQAPLTSESPLTVEITHPALMRCASDSISSQDANHCLQAAVHLRKILLEAAHSSQ